MDEEFDLSEEVSGLGKMEKCVGLFTPAAGCRFCQCTV